MKYLGAEMTALNNGMNFSDSMKIRWLGERCYNLKFISETTELIFQNK